MYNRKIDFLDNIEEDVYIKSSDEDESDDEIRDDLLTHIQKKLNKTNTFCTPHLEQKVMFDKIKNKNSVSTIRFFSDHSYI